MVEFRFVAVAFLISTAVRPVLASAQQRHPAPASLFAATFNALGIVSYKPDRNALTMHSYAMGNVGDFVFTPTADGYVREIPAGR